MKPISIAIAAIFVAGMIVAGCFAVLNDEDAIAVQLVSHDYGGDQDYDQNYGSEDDRNRNRDRNRGAFSPGPFDDSPVDAFNNICMPGATCHYPPNERNQDGRQGEQQQPVL